MIDVQPVSTPAQRAWRDCRPIPLAPLADCLLPAPGGEGHRFIPRLADIHGMLTAIDGRLSWGDAGTIHGSTTCAVCLYHRRYIILAPWLFRVRSEALLLGVLAHEVGHCYAGADDDAAEAWAASHLPTLWHRYQAAYGALKR